MQRYKNDPDGLRLPIKVDSTSNGEFLPQPLDRVSRIGNDTALKAADQNAKRTGLSRRAFQASLIGAASTLVSFNQVNAAAGRNGGHFEISEIAALDDGAALEALGKNEFIFDVQGHFVNPEGKWLEQVPDGMKPLSGMPKAQCETDDEGDRSYLNCLSGDEFVKDVFLESDTDMMVLSFVPSPSDAEPLTIEEADAVRTIIDEMDGTGRLLVHGRANPNQEGDIERMEELASRWDVCAWKCYTQWGPNGSPGFWLTDDVALQMIEEARRLGVRNICIHKGLSFGPESFEHSRCDEVGKVAKLYPDMNFLIYHSGFDVIHKEGPFQDGAGEIGIDTLVQSLIDNEVAPNSNVYAELGSTWRFVMRDPDQAAHSLGKLLKYVGEDNVLWGTDSIWYGSPQDQILAFRTFQIASALREQYGYPELTPRLRAKIFGLNAARVYDIDVDEIKMRASYDKIGKRKEAHADMADPHFRTYGPTNRREFLNLLKWNGGSRI